MKLNQLSLSFAADEISQAIKTAMQRADAAKAQIPPELADLGVEVKGGYLVVSTKKKIGFMPMTLSASIGLRPTTDGEGIVVTLAKISAGFIGSEMIAEQLMKQISQTLVGLPGCSVSGKDVTLTKAALAASLPWLSVPGKVTRFGIDGDTLEISIG